MLPYSDKLRVCDDALKRVGQIEDICSKYSVAVQPPSDHEHFLKCLQQLRSERKRSDV